MVNNIANEELLDLRNQLNQIKYLNLQNRTSIPTIFLYGLLDYPENWRLIDTFFKIDKKDGDKGAIAFDLLKTIEEIAIDEAKNILEESILEGGNYNTGFYDCDGVRFCGFDFCAKILIDEKEIFNQLLQFNANCNPAKWKTDRSFHKFSSCISNKAYAKLLFENKQYEEAFFYLFMAIADYGYLSKEMGVAKDYQRVLSNNNRKNALKRHAQTEPEKQTVYDAWDNGDPDTGKRWRSYAKCAKHLIQQGSKRDQTTLSKWISKYDQNQ